MREEDAKDMSTITSKYGIIDGKHKKILYSNAMQIKYYKNFCQCNTKIVCSIKNCNFQNITSVSRTVEQTVRKQRRHLNNL